MIDEDKKGDDKGDEKSEEHSNKAAASKEMIDEDKKGDGKGDEENEEHSDRAAASKDKKDGGNFEEAQKSSDEEKVVSNSPPKDGHELTSAASKEVTDEDKKVDNNLKDAIKSSDTEEVDPPKDGDELTSGDESYFTCDEGGVLSGDESTTATGNEIPSDESASFTSSHECGDTSIVECGTGDEMGAVGGAKPKEVKGILAVKLKTKKKNILRAIPEIHPENIGELPKKKNIIFGFTEKDSMAKEQVDKVPKKTRIDFDPVMTVRFCYDLRDENDESKEPEVISPGRELLEDIESRVQEDIMFTPKTGDQHRSSFRHQQTVSRIPETREWYLESDDPRYGVHRTYSDLPPQESCWAIFKNNVQDCFCCCCTPSTCRREEVEEDKREATQQEERRENGFIKPAEQKIEDISLNYNANTEEEAKPKRIGVHHYYA